MKTRQITDIFPNNNNDLHLNFGCDSTLFPATGVSSFVPFKNYI
jgi:hypothetical protein